MADIWKKNRVYSFFRPYVDFCTRTSFRSVEVSGREHIPSDGCVIYAPNHCCALMDALMVLLIDKGPIGFGARSDIFRRQRIAGILNGLRILPMARGRNGSAEIRRHLDSYDDMVRCLDAGVPLCIFPEGQHRPERGMMPVRKGIFRIARKAAAETGKRVYVVPVGIDYEFFFRQTGRAAVRIGKPVEPDAYFREHTDVGDMENYLSLCEILRSRMLPLIGQFPARRRRAAAPLMAPAVLSLPVFAVCALLSMLIWLPALVLCGRLADKAWTHTVFFALRLVQPLLLPFYRITALCADLYTDIYMNLKK